MCICLYTLYVIYIYIYILLLLSLGHERPYHWLSQIFSWMTANVGISQPLKTYDPIPYNLSLSLSHFSCVYQSSIYLSIHHLSTYPLSSVIYLYIFLSTYISYQFCFYRKSRWIKAMKGIQQNIEIQVVWFLVHEDYILFFILFFTF